MKKWGIALLLGASLSALALADPKPVANVTACNGTVQAGAGLHKTAPLQAKARLQAGTRLNLPAGTRVTLMFYQDGHREELSGPCLVRLEPGGCQVVHGGSGCLARITPRGRVLVMPQGGNLESVGGSIAGISDAGTSRPLPAPLPPATEPPKPSSVPPPPHHPTLNRNSSRGSHPFVGPTQSEPPSRTLPRMWNCWQSSVRKTPSPYSRSGPGGPGTCVLPSPAHKVKSPCASTRTM